MKGFLFTPKLQGPILAILALALAGPYGLAGEDIESDSTTRPGFKIIQARFDGLTAKEKIKLTFKGEERLLGISDKTIITDGDKGENIPLKDLAKYMGRRVMIFHRDGVADSIHFTRVLDK
jgi:hypothetical protein